ncbi:hypothetical protein BMF94_4135 [Rhodotorula taiwanensis]|uniref:Uncharacterized protein n=1 Tax=Rhodotorula taiwanensis TaxID=741276 RepID=A0A2S5B7I4_9BASI|nr:hypothetical protein BMF94_4135 [Rhodotorula taiwanensis]
MPTSLQSLELHSLDKVKPTAADQVDWTRLQSLRHLTLTGLAFRPRALQRQLSPLRALTSITFGIGAPIEDDALAKLLGNAQIALPRLEIVQLDHVWCERGSLDDAETSEDHDEEEDDNETEKPVLPGWSVPDWPDGCTEAGIVTAITLAEQAGISLIGTALDTIGFDDEYASEAYDRIVSRAVRSQDLRPAIREYGFEAALEYLERKDWRWRARIRDAINPGIPVYRSVSPHSDYSDHCC